MTIYDAAMIGVVIAGMVWGVWRGITWQLASILSLILGYSVSRTLSGQLAPHFPGEPVVARGLAMIVLYAAVSGGVFLVAWIIRTTLRKMQFEAYDRHMGMILGGLEGALLGMVATLFVVSLAPKSREPIFSSYSGRVVGHVMAVLGPVLPDEARKVLTPFWDGQSAGSEADALAIEPEPVRRPEPEPVPEPKLARGKKSGWGPITREPSGDKVAEKSRTDAGDAELPTLGGLMKAGEERLNQVIDEEKSRLRDALKERAEKEIQKLGSGDSNGRSAPRR
jgi:uncharacterized membrane protein required for colicin V production